MEPPVHKQRFAWQPLTPSGVSAFAHASLGRLLLVQFVLALLSAAVVVWFVQTNWFSVINQAIGQLPAEGAIRHGRLEWNGENPSRLAGNQFLALAVDLDHSAQSRSPAHVQLEFGREDCRIFSLAGYAQVPYSRGWVVGFNRVELGPWWGAWVPVLLALVGATVVAGLMVSWAALATLYCGVAWLIGFFANRDLSFRGSWRLVGAALMPAALFFTGAILVYGLGLIDLFHLGLAGALHFAVGWLYLLASPFCLPRHPDFTQPPLNPFKDSEIPREKSATDPGRKAGQT